MTETVGLLLTFMPLIVIIWIANLAEARRGQEQPYQGLAVLAYICTILLFGVAIMVGIVLQLAPFVAATNPTAFEGFGTDVAFESLPLLALGLWLPSLMGILLLLPPIRRFFARFTSLDPESPVHAVALSFTMLVLVNMIITLGLGLGNLADLQASREDSEGSIPVVLWLQQILTALLAMLAVGWLTRRSWSEVLVRLGLTRPARNEWLMGIGLGVGMVPVVLLIEYLASLVGLEANADVERLTEELLGPLFTTPLGILTIGLSAALGEETLFRGAVQPRFGLLFTAILFALVHSQYGITLSTVVVLLLGLVLGWLRLRYSTSTAMITHAVYNMTLGLIAYLSMTALDV